MKKTSISFALFAGLMFFFAGCVQENNVEIEKPGENDIVFGMSRATRSWKVSTENSLQVYEIEEAKDLGLKLEETVTYLDGVGAPGIQTKGTPAYTENVDKLYGKFNSVVYDESGTQVFGDGDFNWSGDKWSRRFYQDPWAKGDPLYFFMNMPSDMTKNGVSDLAYALTSGTQTISFSYVSPTTGEGQQDILFAARSLDQETYEAGVEKNTYPDVLFHHALTGIKFANYYSNESTNTQTVITSVTFEGLYDSGDCVVTPRMEKGSYVDDPTGDYSSQDVTTVVWSNLERSGEEISQTYSATYAAYNSGMLPESFTSKNTEQNLNDANATQTFWFIPQALDENVVVTVKFNLVYVGDKEPSERTLTLKLGKLLKTKNTEWKAGQLRTYTLKPDIVDVDITDDMDEYVKSNVVIENTGNVAQYVRVYMIGNWMGNLCTGVDSEGKLVYQSDSTVLNGYADAEMDEHGVYTNWTEVQNWNDKDFTYSGTNKVFEDGYEPYGDFVGLPEMGTKTAPGAMINNWVRHDKFYYYTQPIGPGARVPNSDPLFTTYTVGESPEFWIADLLGVRRKAKNVHLVMDLAVQAIEAEIGTDGNPTKTYEEAWKAALGVTNINDL